MRVGQTLAQRNTWKRMVGITLAYADQHRTDGWQWSWPDEQNDIVLKSFVDVGPTKLPTLAQQMIAIWVMPQHINSCWLQIREFVQIKVM